MIAFSLTNTKEFMSHLLLADTFDHFSFIEGEIVTFNTFRIDGPFSVVVLGKFRRFYFSTLFIHSSELRFFPFLR